MTVSTATQQTSSPGFFDFLKGMNKKVNRLDVEELTNTAVKVVNEFDAAAQATNTSTQATAATAQLPATSTSTQTTPQTTQAAQGQQSLGTTGTALPDTTESQVSTSGVSIPSSAIAPRTQYDYWNSHIAQFNGPYLTDGPVMRPNCGPASVTMALRMIGLDIPGFNGQKSQAVLDKARLIATGSNDYSDGTTDSELENLITASGGKWSESSDFNQLTSWVKQGLPVIMSGNPAKGWNDRYDNDKVQRFDGGHWVTVSGYDENTGYYIVNDPLSQIGPIYVSEEELRSYNMAHGKLGIAVFR